MNEINHNLPIPNPTDEEVDAAVMRLRDVFTCPICGLPKTHHRLYGYRCSVNPEHDEMARDMNEKQLAEARAKWQEEK